MAGMTKRSFDNPDEVRTPPKTKVEVVDIDGAKVARVTFEPGWRWSECVKPAVGTDTCQTDHYGMMVTGRLGVSYGDGNEEEFGAGDVYHVPPGHDAWVIGDEVAMGYEFSSQAAATYAKPSS
jgi:quercetin dioxygenase-like cupin family protein